MYRLLKTMLFIVIFLSSLISYVHAEETILPIEMLSWEMVNEILPKNSVFTVMDVETGEKFTVQRRAGNRHADVQPLTKEDTKIMKKIYDGQWDWRRRAIIVISDNHWIAASMHGMPHGAGAIKNNFPGHFCIHFNGSKTHRSNNMDLSHKLMIYKAAGKLQEFISVAEPTDIINSYIAGIKQRDDEILATFSFQKMDWSEVFNHIENIKLTDLEMVPTLNDLHLKANIKMDWITKNNMKEKYEGKIYLIRLSPLDLWQVDTIQFLKDSDIDE